MARKKTKLAYIENPTTRRTTCRKRVKGLLKKAGELKILCDIDVCVIIYNSKNDQIPVVWPSSEAEAKRIISEYQLRSEFYQSQRKVDQKSYVQQYVNKVIEKLTKLQRKNREMEMKNLIGQLFLGKAIEEVQPFDIVDLLSAIDDKLKMVDHQINVLKEVQKVDDGVGPSQIHYMIP
ncbi:agamous-like MADS-box protein AGL80 [Amaranthus tricolor]|uniref:agamous-like MADS-box protein AGL80 n=1 Tax=Amaranthus tricolor TaxID=29722 RepID=UPI00258C3D34|nr:agamous-like MADS-box protein AGL80 [Amaranthus tricolor]